MTALAKKRGDEQNHRSVIARSQKTMVVDFLKQPENSFELPCKKVQVRGYGTFALADTMSNLHKKFCAQFPQVSISRAVFCRSRPLNIHLIKYTHRRQCVCHRHANMDLKLEAVKVLPRSPDQLIAMTDEEIRGKLEGITSDNVEHRSWEQTEIEHKEKTYKKDKTNANQN